jgi:hypothetical protein
MRIQNDDKSRKIRLLHNVHLAITTAATIFTLTIFFASTTTSPVSASTTGNTNATAASSSALELSAQPIWDEQATSTSVTPINETHRVATFIGNGTMTVPDTGETINMTNNGTAFISFVPGYAETVSAYGREYVFSEDDNDTTAITFNEIIRYDPATFEGSGLVIAVFDNNATGSLAPFNGMLVVGIHEEDPSTQAATIRLWEWESGIPIPAPNAAITMGGAPLMNTTTTAIDAATVVETNTTATASNGEAEASAIGGLSEEQQQLSVEEQRQAVEEEQQAITTAPS